MGGAVFFSGEAAHGEVRTERRSMVVGLMRRCSCTATCFEPSVVVGVETRLGQGGGRSGPGVAVQAAAGICRGGRWVRSAPADPGEILQVRLWERGVAAQAGSGLLALGSAAWLWGASRGGARFCWMCVEVAPRPWAPELCPLLGCPPGGGVTAVACGISSFWPCWLWKE